MSPSFLKPAPHSYFSKQAFFQFLDNISDPISRQYQSPHPDQKMSTELTAFETIAYFIQAMLYMGLEAHTAIIWGEPQLPVFQILLSYTQIKQNEDNSVRPWDASASNFVLISTNIGMSEEVIFDILRRYRYSDLQMVEQTITAAGFMAWSPS